MIRMGSLCVLVAAAVLSAASTAGAQTPPAQRWSAEIGIGWDPSISGNINSGAIGTLNGQTVVILKNSYSDVYGTGLNLRFGGGYMLDNLSEVRVTFTFQSVSADLTTMGDIGSSRLYAQYGDYQSLGMEIGLRRYANTGRSYRPYAEGLLGIAFVDKTDITLAAPQSNVIFSTTDFYDKTAAFTLALNAGLLWQLSDRFDAFTQLGVRFVTGMSPVDQLGGTGLETINDKSSRWALPIIFGVRARF